MRPPCLVVLLVVAVAASAMPRLARAQSAPELTTGSTVYVTTTDGRTRKGIVVDVRASTLNIIVKGQLAWIPVAAIRQIDSEVRDPIRDGLWRGLVRGAATGAAIGSVAQSCYVTTCSGLKSRAMAIETAAGAGAFFGGIGGAIADYVNHARVQVYPTPAQRPFVVVSLVSRHAWGAGAVIRW